MIGGGPAGLAAAEKLATAGVAVTLFERMPKVGRKLLIAGRGGLNLTHSEPPAPFLARYGTAATRLSAALEAHPPAALRAWCEGLGEETFVGSSGRVFPRAMKASPLLRAWLRRLERLGVRIVARRRWLGWDDAGNLRFAAAEGPGPDTETVLAAPRVTVLALGGASWPRLGADGTWTAALTGRGVTVAPLRPSNCGFEIAWSHVFRERFAGTPLKRIAISFDGASVRGEALVTAEGIEGGAVYAMSAALREAIARNGDATLHLDLRPDLPVPDLARRLAAPRGAASAATFLRKAAGLAPVEIGLLREALGAGPLPSPPDLAAAIKGIALRSSAPQPIERAISTAGGIAWDEIGADFMLRRLPGVFVCGEMLDWEAPTGGYLLQACFATGVAAGCGALARLGLDTPHGGGD